MMRPGTNVNAPAINKAPTKTRDHGPSVLRHAMPMRRKQGGRQGDESEDRQQMDRTEGTDEPDLMNSERAGRRS
jgi:hypothetical protein